MAWYRRSKLGFDAISRYSRSPIQNPVSIINHSHFRCYHVDRPKTSSLKFTFFMLPPVVFLGLGIGVTLYFGDIETIPYTKRKHLLLMPHNLERKIGDDQFQKLKADFEGEILPEMSPETVRVTMILKGIVEALQRGLKKEDLEGVKLAISHLERLKWEVLVVNSHDVNAFCLPVGKIFVFTGMLEHLRTDEEIATIIAHEVAHAVARHQAERVTKMLWFIPLQRILHQFVEPDVVQRLFYCLNNLLFSQRMEIEADYIGMLLMASAGYDPRVAPEVLRQFDKVSGDSAFYGYLFRHPSGKKRSKLLSEASVMQEAISVYQEAVAGREVDT